MILQSVKQSKHLSFRNASRYGKCAQELRKIFIDRQAVPFRCKCEIGIAFLSDSFYNDIHNAPGQKSDIGGMMQ